MSGVRKTFFSLKVTIAACLKCLSFQQVFSPKEKKSALLYHFCFFLYLKGGNLEGASLACISNFVDKTYLEVHAKSLDEMNKALKIQQLNRPKLGLKSKLIKL